jgi:alpha-beta hydrolase superfamily lysophospholipase
MNKPSRIAVAIAFCAVLAVTGWAAQDAQLTTGDGVELRAQVTAATKPGGKGLVLLHMLGRQSDDWRAFADAAAARGYTSVAVDLRGHGKSTATASGNKLVWQRFSDADFRGAVNDVRAAYEHLLTQRGLDKEKIAVVGASIGANLALNFAAVERGKVAAAVLLSPGANYKGVDTTQAVKGYAGPLLIYSAPGDGYSFRSSQTLAEAAAKAELRQFPGSAHGTRAFDADAKYIEQILDWLDSKL